MSAYNIMTYITNLMYILFRFICNTNQNIYSKKFCVQETGYEGQQTHKWQVFARQS